MELPLYKLEAKVLGSSQLLVSYFLYNEEPARHPQILEIVGGPTAGCGAMGEDPPLELCRSWTQWRSWAMLGPSTVTNHL